MALPTFLPLDPEPIWGIFEDEDGKRIRYLMGMRLRLVHAKTFGETVVAGIHRRKTGSTYTIAGPQRETPKRGSWTGETQVKQHVQKFAGTTLFVAHVRQRYDADTASRIMAAVCP